jgi:L-arabinose isomerase
MGNTPKHLFVPLSFFHNPFVTLFYMGNITGQRINQCIKFPISFTLYTVMSVVKLHSSQRPNEVNSVIATIYEKYRLHKNTFYSDRFKL